MRDHVVFYVNGERHEVSGKAACQTLTEYLRSGCQDPFHERLTGTKVACAEGDCGACTVLVGHPDESGNSFAYQSVDACIAFVFQMDMRHLVTVEGLGNSGSLTEFQNAMVANHGSQCGFCTPGFVMALHGMAEECPAREGDQNWGEESLRVALSGNLCRCTGYLQILEAAASVEPTSVVRLGDLYDLRDMLREVAVLSTKPVIIDVCDHESLTLMVPKTLQQLLEFRHEFPGSRLVAGATDLGVQHNHGMRLSGKVIATNQIDELRTVVQAGGELIVGATATWQQILESLQCEVPEYYELLLRFGSPQVRHQGTLAGNLANASPIADSIPFHYVTKSRIEVTSLRGKREIAIEDFFLDYKKIALDPDEVITHVHTPLPPGKVAIKLYKISKRRDMDISTVTAAFWLSISDDLIQEARIAVGGVGPIVKRLPKAEQSLTGQPFALDTLLAAGSIAKQEVQPISDVRGSKEYRLRLVENLFAKFYYDQSAELAAMAG